MILLLGALSLGAVGDSWGGNAVRANGPVLLCKVMPLGDSITVGKSSGVSDPTNWIGFRKDLWDVLNNNDYSVDFVGTQENGSSYSGFDYHHEGYGGWSDADISANIYDNGGENFLIQNPPDVILLHIGTNNFHTHPDYVADILDEINQFESDTGSRIIVIVARIIDTVTKNLDVNTFNNNVVNMISSRSDSDIYIVDMQSGALLVYLEQPAGDMWDNLHPFATGYTKMASAWYAKYDEIFSTAPPNDAPNITNPGNQSHPEGSSVLLQIVASDPNAESIIYTAYNLPPGLSINTTSGLIDGSIDGTASIGSPYNVEIIVSDGNLCGNESVSFTWNISEVNFPPEIQSTIDDRINSEGDYVEIHVEATDPNDPELTYSARNLPSGININPNNGLISGIISSSASEQTQFPQYLVEISVEDDGIPPLDDSTSFTWFVYTDEVYLPLVLHK